MRIRPALSHSAQAVAEGALIALLVVGLMAGTAFAGGKPARYSGTVSLPVLVVDKNASSALDQGDVVTFDITSTSTAPYVQLECFQGGSRVLMGRKGYFEGSLDTNWNFGLASGMWTDGAADCTASLVYYTKRGWAKYASTNFHVGG